LSSNTSKNANPNIQLSGTSSANSSASSAGISSSFGQKKLYAEPQTGKSTFQKLLEPMLPQLPGIAPYRIVLGNVKDKVLLQFFPSDWYLKNDCIYAGFNYVLFVCEE